MAGLQEGEDFAQGLTQQQRSTAAYNALNTAYGPAIANNPANALAAANAAAAIPNAPAQAAATLATSQAEAPLKQAQTATATENATGLQQTNQVNAGIRGAAMLSAIANPDGSIPADEATHILQNPVYGIDSAHIQPMVQRLSAPGGKDLLDQMTAALRSGGKISGGQTVVTNPDGTTSIVRSTQSGGVVESNLGGAKTAPQQQAATGAGSLQERMKHDSDMLALGYTRAQIQAYNAGRGANNSAYGAAPGTTLPGATPASKPPASGTPTAAGPSGTVAAPQVPQLSGKPLATRTDAAKMVYDANANYDTASKVINQLQQQAGTYTTGMGSYTAWLRGSGAANLRANTDALRGQVGSAIISNMKNAQGQMGFRMSNAEFKTLTDSLGALGTEQSPQQFRQHLGYIANAMGKFNSAINGGFKTQFQTDPESALGIQKQQQPAGPGPSPQDIVNELKSRGVVK